MFRLRTLRKIGSACEGVGDLCFSADPWQLVLAQWLMPLVAVLMAAKLFLTSLRRDIKVAFARRSRDHVIVCGVGNTGQRIIEVLRAQGERVVAVDINVDGSGARAAESLGTPTISGDAKVPSVLRLAGIGRARMIVACTGDDTVNIEVALVGVEAAKMRLRFGSRLVVVPEMRADWLFEHFISRSGISLDSASAEVRILNIAENSARVLCRKSAFTAQSILRPDRTDLVVIASVKWGGR